MTRIARLLIVGMVMTSALAGLQNASAQTRWKRARTSRTYRNPLPATTVKRPEVYSRAVRRWPPAEYYYPRYTGAFHARYFDGIPSIYGTRPIRGTAW